MLSSDREKVGFFIFLTFGWETVGDLFFWSVKIEIFKNMRFLIPVNTPRTFFFGILLSGQFFSILLYYFLLPGIPECHFCRVVVYLSSFVVGGKNRPPATHCTSTIAMSLSGLSVNSQPPPPPPRPTHS